MSIFEFCSNDVNGIVATSEGVASGNDRRDKAVQKKTTDDCFSVTSAVSKSGK